MGSVQNEIILTNYITKDDIKAQYVSLLISNNIINKKNFKSLGYD